MKRRYSQYAYRDPAEPPKRKRPYERYAARKMSKLALRRLALQSIGRPAVAQGPLHDALLEMEPEYYGRTIGQAEEMASRHSFPQAVVFNIRTRHLFVHPWATDLEEYLNERSYQWKRYRDPHVVTYMTMSGRGGRNEGE